MIIGPRKKLRKQYPSKQPQIILTISGVTRIRQMKGMYYKNFKILKKEIGEDIRTWKDLLCKRSIKKLLNFEKKKLETISEDGKISQAPELVGLT